MFNASPINARPLNSGPTALLYVALGAAAIAGAVATPNAKLQRNEPLSASAAAGISSVTTGPLFKWVILPANATAGISFLDPEISVYKAALGSRQDYISASPVCGVGSSTATMLVLGQFGNLISTPGATCTATLQRNEPISAAPTAGASIPSTDIFVLANANAAASCGASATAALVRTEPLGYTAGCGITVTLNAGGGTGITDTSVLQLSAFYTAGATETSAALSKAKAVSPSGAFAGATLIQATLQRNEPLSVSATAGATFITPTLSFNIYGRAPPQRQVLAPYASRTVLAQLAPRSPIEDIH